MKNLLPNGWAVIKSSDYCLRVADGTHETPKPVSDGKKLVTSKHIKRGTVSVDGAYSISQKDFDEINRRSKVDQWDVLFSMIGTVGEIALVKEPPDYAIKNVGLFKSRTKYDGLWLYYYLTSSAGKAALDAYLTGTSQQFISLGDLRKVPIIVPTEDTKNRVAAILSAYDDLIENNRRRIALLEKMAEEIYREWFVRMRFPGHEQAKFEKGIPEGWEIRRFRDIVDYYIGGGWGEEISSGTFSEGAYVIRGTDIPDFNQGTFDAPYRFHKPSNLKSRRLQSGDLVFEVSGGSKGQLLGRNLLLTQKIIDFLDGNVMCASFCKQVRFKMDMVSPLFMKYFMKLYYESDLVGLYQIQSTGISNYQFEAFLRFQGVVIPSQEIRRTFDQTVSSMVELKDDLALQNMVLKKSLERLLPRLISGKLSVEHLDIHFPPGMQEADG